MKNPKVLALIPARGGSKGIPRKNIRPFAGHPLIAYSIAAALQAQTVTRVILSTDDPEIADVACSYGAEIPFLRPAELAADRTPDLPVFQHVLNWLAAHEDYHPDVVIHLHPTSPARPPGCLDQAVHLLIEHAEATAVRGVVPPLQTPYKMWGIDEKTGFMQPLLKVPGIAEAYNTPRQSLPPTYLQTGHVNAIRPATILAGSMTGSVILPLILDPRYELDMDSLADWEYGEWVVGKGSLEMIWPEVHP
jgi:CMP-N-acetylneuraminic acid synthetase